MTTPMTVIKTLEYSVDCV